MAGLISLPSAIAQVKDEPAKVVKKMDDGPKTRFLFVTSQAVRFAGTGLDVLTTAQGLNGPTMAYRKDGTYLGHWPRVETGPWRIFGDRNITGIAVASYVQDGLTGFAARKLYADGHKRWAFALNLGFIACRFDAVRHNMGVNAGMDARVRRATGYTGVIVWR
jgi:hypothetical protein